MPRANTREEYAAAQALLTGGDTAGAKTEFERLSSEGPRVYRAMARMEHAAILLEEGDLKPRSPASTPPLKARPIRSCARARKSAPLTSPPTRRTSQRCARACSR